MTVSTKMTIWRRCYVKELSWAVGGTILIVEDVTDQERNLTQYHFVNHKGMNSGHGCSCIISTRTEFPNSELDTKFKENLSCPESRDKFCTVVLWAADRGVGE